MGSEVRYGEIVRLFKTSGWRLLRVRGSHHIFTDGSRIFSVPVHHDKVKYVYVKKIQKLLG